MFTVALIGPDGAGKTTIGRELEQTSGLPVKYLYMGVNREASNVMLPTSRLIHRLKQARGVKPEHGPVDLDKEDRASSRNPLRALLSGIKSWLGLCNRIAEEWYRQAAAWWLSRRGFIVLFDRHFFFDYHEPKEAAARRRRPLTRRLHDWMLQRFYPRPDLVIYLDAPAEVMFARKGEGTVELLEKRRQHYLALGRTAPHFSIVDTTRPRDVVVRDVAEQIAGFARSRSLKLRSVPNA